MRLQQSRDNTEEKQLLARAFAELVCYIENSVENDECIFKFIAQLHSLYVERLQCLGINQVEETDTRSFFVVSVKSNQMEKNFCLFSMKV